MLLLGDCYQHLKDFRDNSIDLLVTDPPYGIEFMGKDWDKALVSTETWKECYRVLKEGKLAFVMCSPRQDVLSRMIINLQDAGFRTNYTSIYWTYASGFPKAANVSKLTDKKAERNTEYLEERKKLQEYLREKLYRKYDHHKTLANELEVDESLVRDWIGKHQNQDQLPTPHYYDSLKEKLGLDERYDQLITLRPSEWIEAEREIIGKGQCGDPAAWYAGNQSKKLEYDITKPATEEAKKMEGAYVGFQPKPAVEIILVVSKGKTLTWLDDCRIPYQSSEDYNENWREDKSSSTGFFGNADNKGSGLQTNEKGRFPANLLVSDDVLNDGHNYKVGDIDQIKEPRQFCTSDKYSRYTKQGDSGSYSRYFSLDNWYSKTFPFIITPKASKAERNKGLDSIQQVKVNDGRNTPIDNPFQRGETLRNNSHPTVKPLKLMSYLITLGSREGDLVLDPFCGSGTVCIAAHNLHRKWIGIEMNPEYAEIIKKRLSNPLAQLKLSVFG